jgi:hypothetical protein
MDYNKPANWASPCGAALASLQTCSAPNAAGSRDLPLFLTQHQSARTLLCMDVFSSKVGHLTRAPLAIANLYIPPLRNASARMKNECVERFKLFAYFVASACANDNFT